MANKHMAEILCIIDGMTDPAFCSADLQNLASMQLIGYQDNTLGGEPETLNCVLHLLGVTHVPKHLRGYIEALGNGISVCSDDLILRGSWYHLDETGRFSAPCDAPEELRNPTFRYYYLGQYKSLLVFPHMADRISLISTCLPSSCVSRKAADLVPVGSDILKRVFLQCLSQERFMALWGQSVAADLMPFPKRAAVVCGKGTVKGIGKALGMDLIPVKGATGDTDTDLTAKVAAALQAAQKYPFVLLHINGADEAAHRKKPMEKRGFLKRVDAQVLARLLTSPHRITVTSDHGTDPNTGQHLGGKQPVCALHEMRITQNAPVPLKF